MRDGVSLPTKRKQVVTRDGATAAGYAMSGAKQRAEERRAGVETPSGVGTPSGKNGEGQERRTCGSSERH